MKRLTPKEAVLKYCSNCVGGIYQDVIDCQGNTPINPCPLYPFRLGEGRPSVKIIRKECVRCFGGDLRGPAECETTDCPLFEFRLGKNPARTDA